MDEQTAALTRAHQIVLDWLTPLEDRPVPAQASVEQVTKALGTELPEGATDAAEVVSAGAPDSRPVGRGTVQCGSPQ